MVHFVGAGPGDPELITVKGLKLIKEADIVIYAGSLVNAEILKACKSDAEIYDSKEMNLQEVLKVFEEAEKDGKNVVRLHTGDPSLYGAIREQMDWLSENGIVYDICPGVSSFSGAAAAIRKEYTLPGVTQTVIITRAEGRTPVPEKEKLSALAAHQATMVLFLSATLSEKVREELMAGGYTEDTPAAVVFRATWPDEEVVWTTLDRIPEAFKREEARRTDGNMKQALIIVGRAIDEKTVYEYSKLYDRDFVTCYRGKRT
jgi:precorrin-4/cobalt-precorrin-4 C11-methyltransferase